MMARQSDIDLKTKQQLETWVDADDWSAINHYFKLLVRPSSHWDELGRHLMAKPERNVWPNIQQLISTAHTGNPLHHVDAFFRPNLPNSPQKQWFDARTQEEKIQIAKDAVHFWKLQKSGQVHSVALMNSALVFQLCLAADNIEIWKDALTHVTTEPIEWNRLLLHITQSPVSKPVWYATLEQQYESRRSFALYTQPWDVFLLQHVAWEALTYDASKKTPLLKALCVTQMQNIGLELNNLGLTSEFKSYDRNVMAFLSAPDLILSLTLLSKYNTFPDNMVQLIEPDKLSTEYQGIYYAILMDSAPNDLMVMLQNAEQNRPPYDKELPTTLFESSVT